MSNYRILSKKIDEKGGPNNKYYHRKKQVSLSWPILTYFSKKFLLETSRGILRITHLLDFSGLLMCQYYLTCTLLVLCMINR